jgi:hypothetical protein
MNRGAGLRLSVLEAEGGERGLGAWVPALREGEGQAKPLVRSPTCVTPTHSGPTGRMLTHAFAQGNRKERYWSLASSEAFRVTLLSFRTSRERCQSVQPGDFKRMA